MAAKFEDEKTLGMQYRAKVRSKSKTSMYSAGGQKSTCGSKFEVEACKKIEELESSKQKINTHAFETEEQIKSLNNKIPQNEKSINRLAGGAA